MPNKASEGDFDATKVFQSPEKGRFFSFNMLGKEIQSNLSEQRPFSSERAQALIDEMFEVNQGLGFETELIIPEGSLQAMCIFKRRAEPQHLQIIPVVPEESKISEEERSREKKKLPRNKIHCTDGLNGNWRGTLYRDGIPCKSQKVGKNGGKKGR